MHTASMGAFPGLLVFLALFPLLASAADWTYSYCSSQNTANPGLQSHHSDWQSNGECNKWCKEQGNYAYAVIQYTQCWCSDYIPQQQTDVSDCYTSCPGFPSEQCGVKDELYIYVRLDGTPSGTAGASKPTSANPSSARSSFSSAVETSRVVATVVQTVTSSRVVIVVPSDEPSTTSRTSTSTTEESTSAPAQTSVQTVTEGGSMITKTIIYTPSPTSTSAAPMSETGSKSSSNTGAIAGGVVGGVAVLAAIVGGVLFLLWRRRRQQQSEDDGEPGVQRYASTMSKSGLLRSEKSPKYPPPIATSFNNNNSKRQSRTMDQDSISPVSASDRRNSSFRVDQRLNPSTIFVFENTSRASVGSLDDSRDYHRTLNVRNPDSQ